MTMPAKEWRKFTLWWRIFSSCYFL